MYYYISSVIYLQVILNDALSLYRLVFSYSFKALPFGLGEANELSLEWSGCLGAPGVEH